MPWGVITETEWAERLLRLARGRSSWFEEAALCQIIGDWFEDTGSPTMAQIVRRGNFVIEKFTLSGPWHFCSYPHQGLRRDARVEFTFLLDITDERLRACEEEERRQQ